MFLLDRADLENQVAKLGEVVTEKNAQSSEVWAVVNELQEIFRRNLSKCIELDERTLEAMLQEVRSQRRKTVAS
jgi:hypothetical protein